MYIFFDLTFWVALDKYTKVELLGPPLSRVIHPLF